MQKKGMRAVMPGHVNYFYREGEKPAHTKAAFKEHNVLTIHSIIVKNSLLLMHKIKYFNDELPVSIVETISNDSPVHSDNSESNMNWYSHMNNEHFRKSLFLKAPLLYSQSGIKNIAASCTSIKSYLKRTQLDSQSTGEDEQWPNFELYSIEGLRRSDRISGSGTNVNTHSRNASDNSSDADI